MWSIKALTIIGASENITSLISRQYSSLIYAFKLHSPAAVHPVLSCRSFRGSKRHTREKAIKAKIQMEKEMERIYGVSSKPEFNQKEWLKVNYFSEIIAFQARLNINFNDHKILMSAFTHPSFLEELKLIQRDDVSSEETDMLKRFELMDELSDIPYEKLSLLGYDTTLLAIKDELYKKYPSICPSICSDVVNFLTSRETISILAKNLAIEDLLLLSRELDNIEDFNKEYHLKFNKEDLLCDTFYSLVGAIVKDLGIDCAKHFVKDFIVVLIHYEDLSQHVHLSNGRDELIKILALNGIQRPALIARTIAEAGIASDFPVIFIGVYCNDCKIGEGSGYSQTTAKFDAYNNAVYAALEGETDFSRLRRDAEKI